MASDEDLNDEFEEAVTGCDPAKVAALLKVHPALLEVQLPEGDTYLHRAAEEGCTTVCKLLVAHGAPVDAAALGSRLTPLGRAAIRGHLETVRWLMAHGAAADGPLDGIATPLMVAAAKGHSAVTEALLSAGADVNREHLKFPQTALDFAEAYRAVDTGQDLVALQLEARGGIRPYAGPHVWEGFPGATYLQHIEERIGIVSPLGLVETDGNGPRVMVRKTRFAPKKYEHQMLFTVGLHEAGGFEIGLCLSPDWPTNSAALDVPRFRWPTELLLAVAEAVQRGRTLAHGDILHAGDGLPDALLDGLPEAATHWLASSNDAREGVRPEGVPETLLLTPLPKPLPRAKAAAAADKLRAAKWKALTLPAALVQKGG